jgi:Lhr-like helicase
MKKHLLGLILLGSALTLSAASKISDEAYRLVRELVTYKNLEIEALRNLNEYTIDCHNVSDEQFAAKKCSDRLAALQDSDRRIQVKHDVLGQEIARHIRQHRDEEWLFMGLMIDDKEFSNLAH